MNPKEVDYCPFVCWGATARAVANHCQKGKVLLLKGELRIESKKREDDSWDNYVECNCHSVGFGPDAKNQPTSAPQPASQPALPTVDPNLLLGVLQQLAAMQQPEAPQQPTEKTTTEDPFQSTQGIPI
jgi:single-stranded DNA-binding protein